MPAGFLHNPGESITFGQHAYGDKHGEASSWTPHPTRPMAHRVVDATWEESLGLLEAVSNSADRFRESDPATRREMFKGLVSNCQIIDGKVDVTLRPWFKTLLDANAETGDEGLDSTQVGKWYSGRDSNPRPSP